MKILYSYRDEDERAYMQEKLVGHEVTFHAGSLQEGEWSGEGVECLCIFVNSSVDREAMDRCSALKLIATRSTGFDHVDLAAAKERGITVSTVPSYGEHTVAEFAFALLLALSRNIIAGHESVEEGAFAPERFTGFDLFEKTIGVIGTGKIGKNTIKIAKGFGMKVIAFDLFPDAAFAESESFEYLPLEEVFARADVISLHLPETPETHHIINKERVEKMKRGMTLINTARGSLLDTEALVYGLEQGIISAAGLDVLSEEGHVADEMRLLAEPHPKQDDLKTLLLNHYLIDHPRVIITPHMAFNTREALRRILDVTVENIRGFTTGTPKNVVEKK